MSAEPPLTRIAAFHAQQCAEKYLKALLALHEVDFPFTHDLAALLDLAATWLPTVDELDDAVRLNVYAVMHRYPGVADDVTIEEAKSALVIADRVRNAVRRCLASDGLHLDE